MKYVMNASPEIAEEADELGGRVVQREAQHGARPRRRRELRADEVLHHRRLLALVEVGCVNL